MVYSPRRGSFVIDRLRMLLVKRVMGYLMVNAMWWLMIHWLGWCFMSKTRSRSTVPISMITMTVSSGVPTAITIPVAIVRWVVVYNMNLFLIIWFRKIFWLVWWVINDWSSRVCVQWWILS